MLRAGPGTQVALDGPRRDAIAPIGGADWACVCNAPRADVAPGMAVATVRTTCGRPRVDITTPTGRRYRSTATHRSGTLRSGVEASASPVKGAGRVVVVGRVRERLGVYELEVVASSGVTVRRGVGGEVVDVELVRRSTHRHQGHVAGARRRVDGDGAARSIEVTRRHDREPHIERIALLGIGSDPAPGPCQRVALASRAGGG